MARKTQKSSPSKRVNFSEEIAYFKIREKVEKSEREANVKQRNFDRQIAFLNFLKESLAYDQIFSDEKERKKLKDKFFDTLECVDLSDHNVYNRKVLTEKK